MPRVTGSPISEYGYPLPAGGGTPPVRTSVSGLGRAATILLALDAATALLAVGLLAWRHSLLTRLQTDPDAVDPGSLLDSDKAARAATGWFILFTLATAVVFVCWFWAARSNAEAYSPNHGTLGVGWAIGGWFVPAAGLVLPCVVARDIYRGTMVAGRRGKPYAGGAVTGWWWALYVVFWLMGLLTTVESGRAGNVVDPEDHLRDLRAVVESSIFTLLVGIAAAMLAIVYVQVVTKTQKVRNREGAWFGGPGMPVVAYGYGPATPGYPMPGPPPAPPTRNAWAVPDPVPAQDRIPAAETESPEVPEIKPAEEPGDRLTPPS
jgi:hypothetical protein